MKPPEPPPEPPGGHDPQTTPWPNEPVPTVRIESPLIEGTGAMIGRYKLLEKIGEGGFGAVWAAEQRDPVRRRVALKIIKLGMDTRQVVARFEAERQALALMDHPNIARVFDAGATQTGRPFFVMELVRGIPITRYCEQERLTIKARLQLFTKVCYAIQHAHQKGIIHRDIKPSNILVTEHDGVAMPKVIDFGIAKATQQELTEKTLYTQFTQFMGTPSYTSPEQAQMSGLDIDTRADIYSLGVLLYELLTGATPFDTEELLGSGLDEMRRIIREREPMRPSTRLNRLRSVASPSVASRRSRIAADLDWIVMKCLEKDRSRRYDTATGLAADVQRHLSHEPVWAMPPSPWYRLAKSWKRNRLAYSAALAVVMALVLGLGAATWAFIRENRAQQEQSRLRIEAEGARAVASEQRDLARRRLYESLVREARSIRQARQVGYRREVFDRLQQALALQTPNLDPAVLRREAVACLGDWVGLDPLDLAGFAAPTTADALTMDGSLVALGTADGRVALYETWGGRAVATLKPDGAPVSLAFDRRDAGLLMVTLRTQRTQTEPAQPLRKLESWSRRADGSWGRDWQRSAPGVFALALTREAPVAVRLDVAASTLELQVPASGELVSRVTTEARFPDSPRAAISPDGKALAFFSLGQGNDFDAQIEVWDLTAERRVARLTPQLGRGFGLSFGAEGKTLACTLDNTLVVYSTDQWRSLLSLGGSFAETDGASLGGIDAVAVPSFQEQTVHLIDLSSGSELASLTVPGSLQAVRFSEDGRVLLVRHGLGCRILHLDVDQETLRFGGHRGGVPAVEFSPDATQLASAGKDRTLRLWELEPPYPSRVLGPLPAAGQALVYHPSGRMLACADYATGRITLWSPESGLSLGELGAEPPHPGAVWSCDISPDGRYLAAVGGGLRVWTLGSVPTDSDLTEWPAEPLFSQPDAEANVEFDPASQHLAYVGILRDDEQFVTGIYLQGLSGDSKPWLMSSNSQPSIIQIFGFLPQSGSLLYLNRNRDVAVLDPTTGNAIRQFPTLSPGETTSTYLGNIRVSPDESKLAMASSTGLGVDVWDLKAGKLLYSLPDRPGSVWWLAWSPDSRRLAVSRADGTIAVWNTQAVEAQLAALGLE